MNARKPSQLRHGRAALVLCAALASAAPALAQVPNVTIAGRDRTAHAVGERAGIEVVLDVGTWPAVPAPGGTIRVGDPARPAADCVITLPAPAPLGCLWDAGVAGAYQLVATYSGDGTYAPAVSAAVAHEILGPTTPERVSIPDLAIAERNAGSASLRPVSSADGRWVAYVSADPRLSDDTLRPGVRQALLFDRRTGRSRRMSIAPDGAPADRDVQLVAISGDGRWVAFRTAAGNLDPADDVDSADWFIADRDLGTVQRQTLMRPAPNEPVLLDIALSFDGRFLAFSSSRSDLVPNDGNTGHDIFRLDRSDGSVALVSRNLAGVASGFSGSSPAMSTDGRFVAFGSSATDLVEGDTNASIDVFVRDLEVGGMERVSVNANDEQTFAHAVNPAISADGRFVAFMSDGSFAADEDDAAQFDIFIRDRFAGTTLWASPDPITGPLDDATRPSISADGTRLAFYELNTSRIYLWDRSQQTLTTVGTQALNPFEGNPETQGFQVSGDGRSVVFDSGRPLVADDRNRTSDVFAYTVSNASINRLSAIRLSGAAAGDATGVAALDDSGSVVAFISPAGNLVAGDTNGGFDAFIRDRSIARTELASRAAAGGTAQAGISPTAIGLSGDGRYAVFASRADDLTPGDTLNSVDVFVYDRLAGSVRLISRQPDGAPGGGSSSPAISRDGRWIAFASSNIALTDPPVSGVNVYLHDTQSATTSVVPAGGQGSPGATAGEPRLSGDGRYLVFSSNSSTLVPGDTNGVRDVFVFDRIQQTLRRVSVTADGTQGDGESRSPEISADGRYVAFVSLAGNLVPGDANGRYDPFVVALPSGAIQRVGNGGGKQLASARPGLSADGRYTVLQASAQGIAAGPAASIDAYVFDRVSRQLRTVVPRTPANLAIAAFAPSISADGRTIAFIALGALAPGGVRLTQEVFVAANPIAADAGFADGFEGD